LVDHFKSFVGAPHELVLSTFGPGVHFVRGENQDEPRLEANGTGKTTFFADAPCWCLYGRTPDGLRNPDIKARFGQRGALVTLTLSIDGKRQVVTRSTNPNRLSVNGKDVGNDDIEALIGLSFDVFTNTVLLGQGRPLFFDLEPARKLELLGPTLRLDRWDEHSSHAASVVETLEDVETELARGAEVNEQLLVSTEKLLADALANWRRWKGDQEKWVEASKAKQAGLEGDRERCEQRRGGLDLEYDGACTEHKVLAIEEERLVTATAKSQSERASILTKMASHKETEAQLTTELKTIGEADDCPLCGQSLIGTDLSAYRTELRKKIKITKDLWTKLDAERSTATEKINRELAALEANRKHKTAFQKKANDARDARDRLTPTIARLTAEIEQIKTNLAEQARTKNPYADQVNEHRSKKSTLAKELAVFAKKLTAIREEIECTKFWVKGFQEVKLLELEDFLGELELTTAATLDAVGLLGWKIAYAVERETKTGTIQRKVNVFVMGPHDKESVRWECWSGGEKQRLRLVGAMALSEVLLARAGVEPSMEILDEPTQHLSPQGIEDLGDLLVERAQTLGRMVFYCDHQSVDSVRFTSVLTVIKDKDGSRLELTA